MKFRRSVLQEKMIRDHLQSILACIFELKMYGNYLEMSPAREAGLLVSAEDAILESAQKKIWQNSQMEWQTILDMENDATLNPLLKKMCPHTRYLNLREPLTAMEEAGWKMTPALKEILCSWHPQLACSSNIENVFNSLEDNCKRSNKNARSSICNMQCLSIRAVAQKVTDKPNTPRGIKLSCEDFEGKDIRAIKQTVWRPDCFSGRFLSKCMTTERKTCIAIACTV